MSSGNSSDTYTTPNDGVAHSYIVNIDILITAFTAGTVSATVSYTDNASNTSVTKTLYNMSTTPTVNLTGTGNSNYPVIPISGVKPNTAITIAITLTGSSTYNLIDSFIKIN